MTNREQLNFVERPATPGKTSCAGRNKQESILTGRENAF